MFRLFCYSVLVLLLAAPHAWAQEQVRVRSADHPEYSRLVFDWGKHVDFSSSTPSPGKLTITFKTDAALSNASEIAAKLRNLSGFTVVSQSPFTISIDVPAESKTRSFPVGNRVVVDVYDPPGAPKTAKPEAPKPQPPQQEPPKAAAEPAKPPEPVKEEPKAAEVKPDQAKEIPAAEVKETPEEPQTATPEEKKLESVAAQPATGHASASVPEVSKSTAEEGPATPDQEGLEEPEEEAAVKPTLITFSATNILSLAAFEHAGMLFVVNDQPAIIISPKFNGPGAETLQPVKEADVGGAKVYAMPLPKGIDVRAQGGGLLWRFIVAPKLRQKKYLPPVREDVQENQPRSGTLFFPLAGAVQVLDIPDPLSGRILKVVTINNAKQFVGPPRSFVDFDILPSPLGMAILPKVDDLEVKAGVEGVQISRPGGLAITPDSQIKFAEEHRKNKEQAGPETPERRVFDFKNWEMGGVPALNQNRNIILSGLEGVPEENRMEGIMTLAKMYLANAQGPESLGFLDIAEATLPGIEENPEFLALRGAARAISGKNEQAFEDLSDEGLDGFRESGYWRAFALANLGDWSQAETVLPGSMDTLYNYPDMVFNRLGLVLAEVALRDGNVDEAEKVLKTLEDRKKELFEPQQAALQYLKGEAARQRGKIDEAKELWKPLLEGSDDLYRAKAGLAYTRLELDQKQTTPEKAIDKLERLRYTWRGDDLEANINYWLGKTYFGKGEYVKGLNIMKEAAVYASETGTNLGARIAAEMRDMFIDLFLSDKINSVSPLDAVALYEQFAELVPKDERGDKITQVLAERLVQADLLDRAAKLLGQQAQSLQGVEGYRIGVRLAAIELINDKPTTAITALNNAAAKLQTLPEEARTKERFQEIALLRAKALSQQGRSDQALALLNELERTHDVNRLRADIAWNAAYWDDAAEALEDVILDQNMSLTRPLNPDNSALVLQRAVALNLASDRIALANMREKYSDAMAQTEKARVFELITRPRQSAALADRDTLMNIVKEVDLFGDFLNSYKANQAPSN
jgi:tetratricopeptide (TPR) repeat protein